MLIGREDVIKNILTPRPHAPAVADVQGELGSGRTTLLRRLQDASAERVPIFDLERYDPGHNGQVGATVSVGAAEASYTRWVDLLSDIARTLLDDDDLAAIHATGRRARGTYLVQGRTSSLLASIAELDNPFGPQDHVRAVAHAAADVSTCFREGWGRRRQGAGPLLLDNVDRVMDQELGRWLVDLLDAVADDAPEDSTTINVVLARTPRRDGRGGGTAGAGGGAAPAGSGRRFEVHTLSLLTEPQVGAFIKEFRGGRAADSIETVRRLHEITSGHPATLRLVCDLLYGPAAPGVDEVDRLVHDLPARGRQQAALLVEQVLRRSGRGDVLRAVQVAAVPRKFNVALLSDLMEADGYTEDVVELFDALLRQSFVERLDEEGRVLRLHEYVRRSLLARLESTHGEKLTQLSAVAASHYDALLLAKHRDERGELRAYGSSYLYESPTWQADVREWLYHSGNLTDLDEQRDFLLHAARLFLDAFFWWGNYVHFEFCDQLVADLGQLVRQRERPASTSGKSAGSLDARGWPDLNRLHAAFVDIVDHYPPRSVKTKGADWTRVRNALVTVQKVCGLSGARDMSELQEHVQGVLQMFFAHTWRFSSWEGAPRVPRLADGAYDAADQRFAAVPEDEWARAWVHFERAELTLARVRSRSTGGEGSEPPDVDLARVWSLWRAAAEIVQPTAGDDEDVAGVGAGGAPDDAPESDDEEPDHELMANLHRLRGELLVMADDIEAAAESYGRAVFHAFLFHLVGGPPDEYTMQFYVDVRARAIGFLVGLWSAGRRADALTAARRAWPAAYAHHRGGAMPSEDDALEALIEQAAGRAPDPLAEVLWPKGPDVSELGSYEGPCAQAVSALNAELQYDLDYLTDLHG